MDDRNIWDDCDGIPFTINELHPRNFEQLWKQVQDMGKQITRLQKRIEQLESEAEDG